MDVVAKLPSEGIGWRPHTTAEFDGDGSMSSSSSHGFRGGQQLDAASDEVGDGAGGPRRHRRECTNEPRREDGETLCLGIVAERAAPDAELDTESIGLTFWLVYRARYGYKVVYLLPWSCS